MGFYDQMNSIADDLLTRFDQGGISLLRMTPGTGPAHNPGPSTSVETPLKATARPVKGAQYMAADSLIKMGDLKVAAKVVDGITPTTGDKIKIGTKIYTIIRFDPTPPAGVTVAWIFYIRGA
jgi:hypothetical protein